MNSVIRVMNGRTCACTHATRTLFKMYQGNNYVTQIPRPNMNPHKNIIPITNVNRASIPQPVIPQPQPVTPPVQTQEQIYDQFIAHLKNEIRLKDEIISKIDPTAQSKIEQQIEKLQTHLNVSYDHRTENDGPRIVFFCIAGYAIGYFIVTVTFLCAIN